MSIKSAVHWAFGLAGLRVSRVGCSLGQDPYLDLRRLMGDQSRPVIFDVGANVGQTIERVRQLFPDARIHAFEPNGEAFATLRARFGSERDLDLNEFALGPEPGVAEFIENTHSDMSSFLEPGPDSWGSIKSRRNVPVSTIDAYCAERGIEAIDILKTDVQGFDLEVLKGAVGMMESHRIHFFYMEILLGPIYKHQPGLDEIYEFFAGRGFPLVSFYTIHYVNDRAGWTDAEFVDPAYACPHS